MSVEERDEPATERQRRFTRGQGATVLVGVAAALIAVSFLRRGEPEAPPAPEAFVRVPPADFVDLRPTVTQGLVPPPAPAAPTFTPSAALGAPQAPAKPVRMASYAVKGAEPAAPPGSAAGGPRDGEAGGRTAVAFKGQQVAGGRAGAAIDTSLVLMPGIYGCILDTAVSSERPGPFQCHTDEAIRSPLGVPLMDAGTVIIGQYDSDVRQGQSRIPGLVVTAFTPQGIPVPLGAVVSDALGRVGLPGQVNRHLAERFGGAVALLFSQGAIDLARAALTQGSGNSVVTLNTGSVQGVAADAVRGTIGMRNTVEKNQGEAIAFFVAAPVSFEDAYRLRAR